MKLIYLQALIIGLIAIAVLTFKIWLFGSLITSSVKSIAGSCGQEYGVEVIPMISGNWFCPEGK